jgi:hypothetical protein
MPAARPPASRGAKINYLIRRRKTTSREELVAHWFANHMPIVVKAMKESAAVGRTHAYRYIATLFDANQQGEHPWDGVAQLWWNTAPPKPTTPYGTTPSDSFQQKAEPYVPWPTIEYVVMDGALPVEPLTLNAPFPCTRSGFFKMSFLVKAKRGTNYTELFDHWLDVHVPNVADVMRRVGGFRYVVNHSVDPEHEPFAGLAELYFPDPSGWTRYRETIKPDGMERWVDPDNTIVLRARTEMVGIP